MIGVHGSHQHLGGGAKLITSFVRELEREAINGRLFSEFVAVAYTPQGISLCRDFGMEQIGRHVSAGDGEFAEIFHSSGDKVARVGHLSKNAGLARAYKVGPAKFTQPRPGPTLTTESRWPSPSGAVCDDLGPPNELETG